MTTTAENQVRTLLEQTEAAHGEYQDRELGGVNDEAWAAWYAAYLVEHDLAAIAGGQPVAVADLSAELTRLDAAYRSQQPGVSWAAYYTARLTAGHDPGRAAG
jgi:hypothetical protein